jgi:hypothetical protein
VRDVEDVGLGRDALDDSTALAGEVVLEPEIGQEGDERTCDAATITASVRPSRSALFASATTESPSLRAAAEVTGPIETHGRSTRRRAKLRAADAEARTTRSPSGNRSGVTETVR